MPMLSKLHGPHKDLDLWIIPITNIASYQTSYVMSFFHLNVSVLHLDKMFELAQKTSSQHINSIPGYHWCIKKITQYQSSC